ncbi:peptide deformylase [Halobacteriovorax marinus]|uniref:Peptide deformylase n=1 Tax=Halobacteriovorax marinus TaxID=97084 RepID=A0A1Y5FBR4_9BACT|nr:peptide deformylase [Halobacteriovorax marinus]
MSVKDLKRMGNPILREVAKEVSIEEICTPEFKHLLTDLFDTMNDSGGIGIAAPQIGVSKQVTLIKIPSDSNRYPETEESKLFTIINPKIEVLDQELQGFWEACLSVPGLRGYVERPRKVKINYLDEFSKKQEFIAEAFLATVFQHEIDHLFGKLYVDRIKDLNLLSYEEEYQAYLMKH